PRDLGGLAAVHRDAHERVGEPERAEGLGRRGDQRDDPARRTVEGESLAGGVDERLHHAMRRLRRRSTSARVSRVRSATSASHFMISSSGALRSMASSRFVTATPNSFRTRRVSSLGISPLLNQRRGERRRSPRHPPPVTRGGRAPNPIARAKPPPPPPPPRPPFPPPYRAAIQPAGSSRNGVISVAERRTSHLKRIVPANGSWTPSVAVKPGQTRANSSRICLRDGRSTPRLIRLRLRYGSISSQHHGAITTAGVYHEPVKNLELARLFDEMASLLEVANESVFRVRAYTRAAQTLETLGE